MKEKENISLHQNRIKRWFEEKFAGNASFVVGDLVLKWDKAHEDKGKHTKFQSLWIGSYMVHENIDQHMYHLQSLDGRIANLPVNGQDLKCYFQ